jgi:hypothetical protein
MADFQDKKIASSMRTVSEIFAGIGMDLEWHPLNPCSSFLQPIKISPGSDSFLHSADVLAYALPFEGEHIFLFYSRVGALGQSRAAGNLLAYVMAHEITHVLQGVKRHSNHGIMKAAWAPEDFKAMREGKLGFDPEDVAWIHRGLDARARKADKQTAELASRQILE